MKSKKYSLSFVGLALMLAASVMACAAPAPTPTSTPTPTLAPTPTPTPAPTPTLADGWVRLRIADVGSIDYPTNFLELQSQDYRDYLGKGNHEILVGKSDFTLQQAGLNEMRPSAFNEYRRVIHKTAYLAPGDEVFRSEEKYTLSQKELADIRNELISEILQDFKKLRTTTGLVNRIVEDRSLEIVEINGMYPLVYTYKRQLGDNPVVSVKHYMFFDYSRIHHLFLEYRVMDEGKSGDIYEKILHSFRL